MTQKQYQRIIAINERLKDLENVRKELNKSDGRRLIYHMGIGSNGWMCGWAPNAMDPIRDILDKHDLMIRKEIDEEIERLKKEIETL